MRTFGNGIQRFSDLPVIVQRLFKRGATGDEFLEIASGGEGCVTVAAHDDAAHTGVGR